MLKRRKKSLRKLSYFSRVFRKKGISAVVAIVLIILITIAAIVILWASVVPIIRDQLYSSGGNRVDMRIVTDGGYTVWDGNRRTAMVQVKRGPGDTDVSAVEFYFSDSSGDSHNVGRVTVPEVNGMMTYSFYFNNFKGNPVSVGIAAVFSDGSVSDILSKVTPLPIGNSKDAVIDLSEENPSTEGCDGCAPGADVTFADVVIVTNDCDELQAIDDFGASYQLLSNIDCENANIYPIGYDSLGSVPFTGEFSGNGYTISNFRLDANVLGINSHAGFFMSIGEGGVVRDLTLEGVWSEGIYSQIGILTDNNLGTIENSHVSGTIYTSSSPGTEVGGLVARNGGTIIDSTANVNIDSQADYVGGLVGSNSGTISGSSASGYVYGSNWIGGLVGSNSGDISGYPVYVDGMFLGGIGNKGKVVGYLANGGNIAFESMMDELGDAVVCVGERFDTSGSEDCVFLAG